MLDRNAEIFTDSTARESADRFIRERVEGVRSCLLDLARLCSFGDFQLGQHLITVREMLSSLGEAHAAYNTALLLRGTGGNRHLIDRTGRRQERVAELDGTI